MFRFGEMSILYKLIIPFVAMVVAILAIATGYFYPQSLENMQAREEANHEYALGQLAEYLAPYVESQDLGNIESIFSMYKHSNPDVVNVKLLDSSGGLLYQLLNVSEGVSHSKEISALGKPLGEIVVLYDSTVHQQRSSYALNSFLAGLAFALVLLIAVSFVLYRYVVKKPIDRLLKYVNSIAYGNFDDEIYVDRNDEFGELAASVKMMRNNIVAFQKSLKDKTICANELAESLYESDKKMKCIIDNVALGVVVLNGVGEIESVNQTLCGLLERKEEELLGHNIEEIVSKKRSGVEFVHNYIHSGVSSVIGKGIKEIAVVTKAGDVIPADMAITEMSFGRDRFFNVVISDATERKMAEARLKAERDRAKRYLDAADVVMVALDPKGNVKLINPKGCDVIGVTEAEAIGTPWKELCFSDSDRESISERVSAQLDGNNSECFDASESILQSKNGDQHIVSWRYSKLVDESGLLYGVLWSGTDITKAKQAEEEKLLMQKQLQQSQKMEAIGQLTGGIAHDFNNLVASILGHTELMMHRMENYDDAKVHQYLKNIHQSSERARELVAKMLAFSRGTDKVEQESIEIKSAVDDIIGTLRSVLPATIELTASYDDGVLAVSATHIDLQQIVMNLCINARDAMDGAGTLYINVHKAKSESLPVCTSCHEVISGEYVVLSVGDSGDGISDDIIDRLFEPFFTTKDVGKGTGMGLSVVHGIVHELGGHICVDSAVGKGTTISIYLREAELCLEDRVFAKELHGVDQGRGKTILVIDDEPLVRDFVSELLAESAYDVVAVAGPLEAVEVLNSREVSVDAIITDQSMPGMTGMELARVIKSRFDIPIILCTGYREGISDSEIYDTGISSIVHKPMTGDEILSALDKVVGHRDDGKRREIA